MTSRWPFVCMPRLGKGAPNGSPVVKAHTVESKMYRILPHACAMDLCKAYQATANTRITLHMTVCGQEDS